MALQQPNSPAAETRTFIGPFLRFGGGAGPGDPSWRGSVLVLTRAAPADEGSPAGGGNEFSPTGGVGSPTGSLSTPVADARPPVGDATQRNGVGARPSDAPTPSLTLDDSGGGGGGGGQQLEPRALETCLGWTFWRFDLHLQLREWQRPVHYSVRSGATRRAVRGRGEGVTPSRYGSVKGTPASARLSQPCSPISPACACRRRLHPDLHLLAARCGAAHALVGVQEGGRARGAWLWGGAALGVLRAPHPAAKH